MTRTLFVSFDSNAEVITFGSQIEAYYSRVRRFLNSLLNLIRSAITPGI